MRPLHNLQKIDIPIKIFRSCVARVNCVSHICCHRGQMKSSNHFTTTVLVKKQPADVYAAMLRIKDVPNMTNSDIYNDSAHINEWRELNEKIIRKWIGLSDNRRFFAINDCLWSR